MSPAADTSAARVRVTVVIVAHDGAGWLPTLISGLAASTRAPDAVIAVDTGSQDSSAALLTDAYGPDRVTRLDRRTGFGAAVAAGLATLAHATDAASSARGRHFAGDGRPGGAEEWVWLLHDDCAPEPDTLERLLEAAASCDDIAVVGCRIRAWPSGRRLLEVGVTITGTGHRETGLEPGERDQGQHDEMRDVLGVSTAGMLVRRRLWDDLGGLDPRLPLFRDDVDFGWRTAAAGHRVVVAPNAVLFHAEASSSAVRAIDNTSARPHRADRRAAVFTVLANCRVAALPLLAVRLLLGSLLRALGYLIGKLPRTAWDEVVAAASIFGRPWVVMSARSGRRRSRSGRIGSVRRLLPPWWAPYANGLDSVVTRLAETARQTTASVASSARRVRSGTGDAAELETGPVPDEAVNLPGGDGIVATLVRHPLLVLTTVLLVAGLIASRGLWGGGFLQGGALPPAPDGAGDWWRLSFEAWHPVGLGSTVRAAPYVVLLALPATLLLGKAWLLVDVLMLLAPVLAGLGAWRAAGRLVRGLGVRVWMTVSYALVPVVTGAVSSGHLGTVVVAIVLPWVAWSGCRLLDLAAPGRWGTAFATGLALSVATAFASVVWPIVVAVGLVSMGWLVWRRQGRRVAQWSVALVLPVVLLLPWSWHVLAHPGVALTEAGRIGVPGLLVGGSAGLLALGRAGAVGAAPGWLTAGITIVALVALLRADTRSRVAAAWVVVAIGLVAAAAMSDQTVAVPLGHGAAYPWLGVPVVVVMAGLVAAGGLAADGLASYVGSGSFGWRQPVAAVSVFCALSAPLLGLGWWVGTASHGDLHRDVAIPLPAYMIQAMSGGDDRTLVLQTGSSTIHYDVLGGDGLRIGDESVLPAKAPPGLATLIASLLSDGRPADVRQLGGLGIRYVVLPSPQSTSAVAQLDALPGLTQTSSNQAVLSGWQVDVHVNPPAHVARTTRGLGWIIVLAAAWSLVAVLAAPGIRRRPLPAPEAPR